MRFSNDQRYGSNREEHFAWLNGAGETIPAYGIIRLSSAASRVFTAVKPDGEDGLYYANGPVGIPNTDHGSSLSWIRSQAVMFNPSDTVSVGDTCGPIDSQWYMGADGTGWRVFVTPDADDIAFVVQDAAAGSGGETITGIVEDNACDAGTLDILVGYPSDPSRCSDTITVNDYFGVMAGHTAAQLVGAKALAGYVWDCDASEWEWHLWLLGGLDECTGLPV